MPKTSRSRGCGPARDDGEAFSTQQTSEPTALRQLGARVKAHAKQRLEEEFSRPIIQLAVRCGPTELRASHVDELVAQTLEVRHVAGEHLS